MSVHSIIKQEWYETIWEFIREYEDEFKKTFHIERTFEDEAEIVPPEIVDRIVKEHNDYWFEVIAHVVSEQFEGEYIVLALESTPNRTSEAVIVEFTEKTIEY